MGNCLPKPSKKRSNRVEPCPVTHDDVHQILSKSSEFKKAKADEPADMTKALKGADLDDLKKVATANNTTAPSDKAKAAVAFDVGDTEKPAKIPKRLADRLEKKQEPNSVIEYSVDEECLMAEILREDRLKELKDKAIQEDIKVFDAQRRKMAADRAKEAKAEEKARCSTPIVSDQRQKVKALAEEDRRKAAERRKAGEKKEKTD